MRRLSPSLTQRRAYVSVRDLFTGAAAADAEHVSREWHTSAQQIPTARLVNGRYVSPWTEQTEKSFTAALKWMATRQQNKLKLPPSVPRDPAQLLDPLESLDSAKVGDLSKAHATWIGHATMYLQIGGLYFITDPMFSDRCSPSQLVGPKRFVRPPAEIEDLDIDVVLLSHTHYDHLDYNSAMRISNKVKKSALWLVPLGVKAILADWGIVDNVVEMDWWQTHTLVSPTTSEPINVHFLPAKHWTARTPLDRNTCLWGGFAVTSQDCKFYFTGDTAYEDRLFKQIGAKFGPFDLCAIPIGAYKPRNFMRDHHCDPEEAVQIHNDVRSKQSIAIHWGTFPLADEDVAEPALELARIRQGKALRPSTSFFTMRHGATHCVGDVPPQDFAETHEEWLEMYTEAWESNPALRL